MTIDFDNRRVIAKQLQYFVETKHFSGHVQRGEYSAEEFQILRIIEGHSQVGLPVGLVFYRQIIHLKNIGVGKVATPNFRILLVLDLEDPAKCVSLDSVTISPMGKVEGSDQISISLLIRRHD